MYIDSNKLFGRKVDNDTPLRVCYRNQKDVIVAAHALGMGIYRKGSLPIQMPRTIEVWDSIGYNHEGDFAYGKNVTLYRPKNTSPNIITVQDEVVQFCKYEDIDSQYNSLVEAIRSDLNKDGLLHKDIIVIDLDSFNAEKNYSYLALINHGIQFHYAGKSNPEDFFRDDSIVYSSVFRAKGNEAFMVYIVNAQQVINTYETITLRNALFTAMTRSKGWVNVLGFGDAMDKLTAEFELVRQNNYQLVFNPYPTNEQLKQIRTYNNDLNKNEMDALNKTKETIKKLINESDRDPLLVAQDLFGVQTKEELLKLLMGDDK